MNEVERVPQVKVRELGILWRKLGSTPLERLERMAQESESRGIVEFFLADSPEVSLLIGQRLLSALSSARVTFVVGMDYLGQRFAEYFSALQPLLQEFPRRMGMAVVPSWGRGPGVGSEVSRIRSMISEMDTKCRAEGVSRDVGSLALWATSFDDLRRYRGLGLPLLFDGNEGGIAQQRAGVAFGSLPVRGVVLSESELCGIRPAPGEAVDLANLKSEIQRVLGPVDMERTPGVSYRGSEHDSESRSVMAICEQRAEGIQNSRTFAEKLNWLPHGSTQRSPSRLRRFTPDLLDESQAEIYSRIRYGPRGQGKQVFRLVGDDEALEGPFNAWLLSPQIGSSFEQFGDAMRFSCTIDSKWREIAILAVGSFWGSSYERYAHEAVARQVGVSEDQIDAIKFGRDIAFSDHCQTLVAQFAWRLLECRGRVDQQFYQETVDQLGETAVFEIAVLVGYYSMLALQLEVFQVSAPIEQPDD